MATAREGEALYRAAFVRTLPEFLARYPGVPAERLLVAAGVDRKSLEDPEAFYQLEQGIELLERAAEETGDACFGVAFASQVPWSDVGVLGYVMHHSPTFGIALSNARRYFAVQQTEGELSLDIGEPYTKVGYTMQSTGLAHHQVSEIVLTMLTRLAREGTKNDVWAPRRVRLRRPHGEAQHRLEAYFRAPVQLQSDVDELEFESSELSRPLVGADAGLLPILLQHAEACLGKMAPAGDYIDRVRRELVTSFELGEPNIELIAERMHSSVRSVQRRLREQGVSFSQMVSETRLALSMRYLDDPSLSLTETAYLLGYSDLSAFSRAFRRWTGKSALEVRKTKSRPSATSP